MKNHNKDITNLINSASKISIIDFLLIEDLISQMEYDSYKFTLATQRKVAQIDSIKPLGCKFSDLFHALQFNYIYNNVFANSRVLEIGGALPAAFSKKYLRVKQWTSIEKTGWNHSLNCNSDGSQHINNPKHIPLKSFEHFKSPSPLEDFLNQKKYVHHAEDRQYDVIYSIASFEHIQDLKKTLQHAYSCLREGGKLIAYFCEIWSSKKGHLGDTIPEEIKRIHGDHAHLSLNKHSMTEALIRYCTFSPQKAATTSEFIFEDDGINRLLAEDYIEIFQSSGFSKKEISPFEWKSFDEYYSNNPQIVDSIRRNYPTATASCEGFSVCLEK